MTIYRDLVPDGCRVAHTAGLFGIDFSRRLEPHVFTMAERLSPDYRGGYWDFYALSNGGFYIAPAMEGDCRVRSENGFEGSVSADALGLTACLYTYSHLSFAGETAFSEACAEQYHLLREFSLDHAEAGAILRAID